MTWTTDSYWFEIAIVSIVYAVGNITFGHFEEQTPKIRRLAKYVLTLAIIVALSAYFGRVMAMTVLALLFIPVIYIHAVLLPKKGVNGWTGEPKEKYYEIRGWDKSKLRRKN